MKFSPLLPKCYATTRCSVSVQFSSVTQSCPTLCDPMNCSTPGLPFHHQFPVFTQTHVHWVDDAIQPSHSLLSPYTPAPNPSQDQGLFQWVNSLHEVAKVLEFQLHLLIKVLRLTTFSVNAHMVGFKYTILLFVFYLCHMFFIPLSLFFCLFLD